MRRLLLYLFSSIAIIIVFTFVLPVRAVGMVTLVQAVPGATNFGGTVGSTAFTANNTSGNTIIVLVQWQMGAGTANITSVTDASGNSYTLIPASLKNAGPTPHYANIYTQIAYATNIVGGANTVTVNWNGGTGSNAISLLEVTPSVFDQASVGTGSSNAPSAGSLTTSLSGAFAAATTFVDDGFGVMNSLGGGASWTLFQNLGGGSAAQGAEYEAQATAGSISGNFSSLNGTWVASMATFIPSGNSSSSDTTPPTTPTNLATTTISSSQINLSWTASTDNVGVSGYKIFRNGTQIGTSTTNSYGDTGLIASTQYTYMVSAYDTAGNQSALSSAVSATTQLGSVGSGNNIYLAQTALGAGNGSSCANAIAYTFFNIAGNWGSGAGKIGPGTTVHLCGAITGAAGANGLLAFQGSGAAGNPITLLWEPGAIVQAPYVVLGIDMGGRSYITVDGGVNGIIRNTANGDALANKSNSQLIGALGCFHCTIQNLNIGPVFVHVKDTQEAGQPYDHQAIIAAMIGGSGFTFSHNSVHDCGWCINLRYDNETGITFADNDTYNYDHALAIYPFGPNSAGSNIFVTENKFHDAAIWDCGSTGGIPNCHHDSIHSFASPTDNNTLAGLYVSNNYFYGDSGASMTGHIYIEGGVSPAHIVSGYYWNNVFEIHSGGEQNTGGWVLIGSGSAANVFVNNSIIGEGYNDLTACLGLGVNPTPSIVKNNMINKCGMLLLFNHVIGSVTDINYNYYGQSCFPMQSFNNCFFYQTGNSGMFLNSFSNWKSTTGWDSASLSAQNGNSYLANSNLFNANGFPQTGAPVLGAGTNLTALATGPMASLAFDTTLGGTRVAVARPTSGAWDIGAFQVSSGGGNPTPVPGDLNLDHVVNSLDYSLMNAHWFQNYPAADLVVDGLVNTLDFAVLKSNWGKTW